MKKKLVRTALQDELFIRPPHQECGLAGVVQPQDEDEEVVLLGQGAVQPGQQGVHAADGRRSLPGRILGGHDGGDDEGQVVGDAGEVDVVEG